MSAAQSTFKAALRLKAKDILLKLSADSKKGQSDAITKKVNICINKSLNIFEQVICYLHGFGNK